MNATLILHHDDPPCYGVIGGFGNCLECGIIPDMQSTCFWYCCPKCGEKLENLLCEKCNEQFIK